MTDGQVVVGVDGSAVAVQALDRAAEEAVLRGTALEIVYAVPDPKDAAEAGPVLASALARVRRRHPELEAAAVTLQGDPAQVLLRRGRDAALTVVGSRGLGEVAGLLIGSVSSHVAAHTTGPLLVVRGHRAGESRKRHSGEVLLGVESDADAEAAAYAFEEAERRGARLRILHAWTYRPPSFAGKAPAPAAGLREDIGRHARAEAAVAGRVVAELRDRHPRVGVETRSVRSGPVHALLEATADADIVVIAAHRRPGRLHPVHLGPVSHALLRHSHCPVVLVPTAPAAPAVPTVPATGSPDAV